MPHGPSARQPAVAQPLGVFVLLALLAVIVAVVVLTAPASLPATRPELSAATAPTVAGVALDTVVAKLDTVVREAMRREGVAGVSVAIVGDGKLLWAKGYGLANRATGEAVTDKTVFRGASFSKNLTAYLALRLVEEGVLELDRPLIDYTGEAYLYDPRIKDISLRMILAHTSGFTDRTATRGDIVLTPGRRWSYSSDAFRYLQWVVERLTGQPFAQYAADHLFSPLGMEATSFVWRDECESLISCGYEPEGEVARRRPDRANAAYGVLTTPSDFARLVLAMMNPVEDDPDRLSRASVEAMLTPQVELESGGPGLWWGLGWGLERSADVDCFWQWGWVDGFRNLAVCDLDARVAVVVMTNGAKGLRVARDIVRAVLPGEHPIFPALIEGWE